MAGPIDDLRHAMTAFGRAAEPVLKMLAAAEILTKSADRVSGLELRETEVRQSIAELESNHAARMQALQAEHEDAMKAFGDARATSRLETDQIIARTRREATDFIKTTEQSRQSVQQSLKVAQKELFDVRRQVSDERENAEIERRRRAEASASLKESQLAEIREREVRIAELRRMDADIQERLAAISAARR